MKPRRLLSFGIGGVGGAAVGVVFSLLAERGQWLWVGVFLSAVVLVVWAWAAWSLSDGHLYAVYERRRKRELRRNRG